MSRSKKIRKARRSGSSGRSGRSGNPARSGNRAWRSSASKFARVRRSGKAARLGAGGEEATGTRRQGPTEESIRRLLDPRTRPAEFRELIDEAGPCSVTLVPVLLSRGSTPARLDALVRELVGEDSSAALLSFAAAIARVKGDDSVADRLLGLAFAAAEDPDTRVDLMAALPSHGRLGDALELLRGHLRDYPEDEEANEQYGMAIMEAVDAGEDIDPRVSAALAAFADRSALRDLQVAVAASLPETGYGPLIRADAARWLRFTAQEGWDDIRKDALLDLGAEFMLLATPRPDLPPDAENNALMAFAKGRSGVDDEMAERARTWRSLVRYGLWRVDDLTAGPGIWCLNIITGASRYVEFPPEARSRLVGRGVWYGAIVPVDGVWRSTGLGTLLSPAEADAAAEWIMAGVLASFLECAGNARGEPGKAFDEGMPLGEADAYGVVADYGDLLPAEAALAASRLAGTSIPRVLAEVYRYRGTAAPANQDGDPVCLISAEYSAAAPQALQAVLLQRSEFVAPPGKPGLVLWLGEQLPSQILGSLRFTTSGVVVNVNSQERLARLLALLSGVDSGLSVIRHKEVDPVLHSAWPPTISAARPGEPVTADEWEEYWADQSLPILGGKTPRQAAKTGDVIALETLLRQFEYQAALLAQDGKTGVDVAALRWDLDMDDKNQA